MSVDPNVIVTPSEWDSLMGMVSTVNDRLGKLQSDTKDIKIVQATDHRHLEDVCEEIKLFRRTLFGNGTEGLVAQVAHNKRVIEGFQRIAWLVGGAIVVDIAVRLFALVSGG